MKRGPSLIFLAAYAIAIAGCADAPRKPAPVEDRTAQRKPAVEKRAPAPVVAAPKPSVAVVKPLPMPAEPKLIPIPVPEAAVVSGGSLLPAPDVSPQPPASPAAGLATASPSPAANEGLLPEPPAAGGEGGRQYRPNAAVAELLGKANALEKKRDFAGAIAILERGLQIAPNDPMLWNQLARMRFANGELQQAKRIAERSNSLARSYPAIAASNWMLIGQVEKLAGHADAASRAFSAAQAVRTAP